MADANSGEILKSVLISIVRHFLGIVAAYLVSRGLVSQELASEGNLLILAGGIVAALTTLGWIVYNKLKTRNLVQAALEAPTNTPIGMVKLAADEKPLLGD